MRLLNLVCAGQIEIAVAQKAIAGDWIEAWLRYVRLSPLLGSPSTDQDRNAG